MKKLFTLLVVINAAFLQAQPTITTAQLPYAGLAYLNNVDTLFNVAIPPGGAMQTWNFSTSLNVDGLDTLGFINAAGTPYVNDFPGANLASNNTTDSVFTYFITNANGFYFKGIYFYGGTTPLPFNINKVVFNPANLYLPTPITYNTSLNTFYRFVVDVDTGAPPYIRVVRRTEQAFLADGYGTVQLPGASYPNCLRVKNTETAYDSISADLLGIGFYVSVSNSVTQTTLFNFIRQTQPALVLSITADSLGITGQTASWFEGTAVTSVSETPAPAKAAATVFPNPASNLVVVSLPESGRQQDVFRLFDMQGRVIRETSLEGMNQYGFYVNNLASGTYFWTIQGRGDSGRLVVQ